MMPPIIIRPSVTPPGRYTTHIGIHGQSRDVRGLHATMADAVAAGLNALRRWPGAVHVVGRGNPFDPVAMLQRDDMPEVWLVESGNAGQAVKRTRVRELATRHGLAWDSVHGGECLVYTLPGGARRALATLRARGDLATATDALGLDTATCDGGPWSAGPPLVRPAHERSRHSIVLTPYGLRLAQVAGRVSRDPSPVVVALCSGAHADGTRSAVYDPWRDCPWCRGRNYATQGEPLDEARFAMSPADAGGPASVTWASAPPAVRISFDPPYPDGGDE